MSQNVKEELIETPGCSWVKLKKITWKDPQGKTRLWEAAYRPTRKGAVDAVLLVPILKKRGQPDKIVLVSQFRPPVGKMCIETPAGLVDAGESYERAALRELKEETGYFGKSHSARASPVVSADAGMSSATCAYVHIEIDGDDPDNLNPVAAPDEGEFIETHLVSLPDLLQFLDNKAREGWMPEGKLYAYALGLPRSQESNTEVQKQEDNKQDKLVSNEPHKSNMMLPFLVGMVLGVLGIRLVHSSPMCRK